jgi:omega-6 fatty acid desaturase (delta-12 desaturase)
VWVVGHECGHQSFSESKAANNFFGMITHSVLLVPYHSWRISHGMHHKATSHMDRDQVFVPSTRSNFSEALNSSPLTSTIGIIIMLTLGWPAYLLANVAGQNYGKRTNHFEPASPIFKANHRNYIVNSDIGLIIAFALLGIAIYKFGFAIVMLYYGVPYLWTNFWLVLITYLHHTHRNLPHYRGKEWTFLRGALCTIDRDYGPIVNFIQHNIGDTHICHHIFSTIPHYHAKEATEAMKPILGKYYKKTDASIISSLYECWTECQFVEDSGDILYYKNMNQEKSK